MAEFIITLKVDLPTVAGDTWTDPTMWNWTSAIFNQITGRQGTRAVILNVSPMKYEDEEEAERFPQASAQREQWEWEKNDG